MTNEYTIAAYLRISEDDGLSGESQSINGQRELLEDFISAYPEFQNARRVEFSDDGWSGTNFNRPGVKQMLEQVKSGKINCIIVKDFSRFGRNYIEVGEYLEQIFPFLRIRFISVNDFYDSDKQENTAGDINVAFKNLCNDYYSKDLSRKIKVSLIALRESGKCLSPGGFFGYKLSESVKYHLDVDEKAAVIVKRIFDMALSGKSTQEIAVALNADGVPTPMVYKRENGNKRKWNTHTDKNAWSNRIVLDIIRDIRYTGALVHGKTRCDVVGSGKVRYLPREEWFIVPDQYEAIVSKDDYDEAQGCIKLKKPSKSMTVNENPLAGKVRCGGCGYTLKKDRGKYGCVHKRLTGENSCLCGRISVSLIESTLIIAMQKLFEMFSIEEQRQKECQEKCLSLSSDLLRQIQILQKQIDMINNAKLALYHKYSDGEVSKDEYLTLRGVDETHIRELTEKAAALEEKRHNTDILYNAKSENEIVQGLRWNGKLTCEITDALLDRVFVYDENHIEIKWKFTDTNILTV